MEDKSKAAYSKPKLTEYGRVTQFTHGSLAAGNEVAGGKKNLAL
jgi:hypothetical protein